jgi:hypothetical protein
LCANELISGYCIAPGFFLLLLRLTLFHAIDIIAYIRYQVMRMFTNMVTPRIYLKSLSIKRGGSLPIYASYGDSSVTEANVWLRIFPVEELSKDDITPVKVPGGDGVLIFRGSKLTFPTERTTLKGTGEAHWNREAIGYQWPLWRQFSIEGSPDKWPIGLYAAQISGDETFDKKETSTAYFLVRPSSPQSKILLCWPWSTTVAYAAAYADKSGDFTSLYGSDESTRGRRVSLERPLERFAHGEKRGYTHRMPLELWNFLISTGMKVDPCNSFDLHGEPDILKDYNMLISVGHDEYWSTEMRDRVEAFVRAGGNVAFFSANTCWWRIKLDELNVMTCKKSAMEDPRAGFDGDATSNWASSPTDRPENTLTGVSFRRGSMMDFGNPKQPYIVVADTSREPFMDGLTAGATIPSSGVSMFTLETDAADFKVERGRYYLPTGFDGTPTNFRILAIADFSKGRKFWRKMATMGYFTNVGTVFTAGTTEWADWLNDAAVKKVTENVVRILSKRKIRPRMRVLSRPVPGLEWSVMREAPKDAAAICALYQGDLLLQRKGKDTIHRSIAEIPRSAWEGTAMPSVVDVVAFGTDVYSSHLFAISSSGGLKYRRIEDREDAKWQDAINQPSGSLIAVAAAARNPLFVVVNADDEQMLYSTHEFDKGNWTPLGKLGFILKCMSGWDTKLFALGEDGQVYCRESSNIDLVWTRIAVGTAGEQLSLSAYFGRLMVLAVYEESKKIMWRTATSTFGSIEPFLLFSRHVGDSIVYALGPLPGSGDFWTTGDGMLRSVTATNVTYVQPATVFFYNRVDGSGTLVRFSVDGTLTIIRGYGPRSFGEWTHIISVPGVPLPSVLFYNSSSGKGVVGTFDEAGNFLERWSADNFRKGWTSITSTWSGNILFYDSISGDGEWGILKMDGSFTSQTPLPGFAKGWTQVVPAGNHYLYFYNEMTGIGALGELSDRFKTVWTQGGFKHGWVVVPSSNGAVLFYDKLTGEGVSGGFNGKEWVPLRTYPPNSFQKGWEHICPIGFVG